MARLEYQGKTFSDDAEIRNVMADYGVPFERWGARAAGPAEDAEIIELYGKEVDQLKKERGYVTVDLVALRPTTPNIDQICAKFDKVHHHVEDEVRFTVEGEGVFEISYSNVAADDAAMLKFTAEPGDLIVIPANRRHLFYLTAKKTIRCIRLFKTKEGWEALYERPSA